MTNEARMTNDEIQLVNLEECEADVLLMLRASSFLRHYNLRFNDAI
jgi:hypothetical protein